MSGQPQYIIKGAIGLNNKSAPERLQFDVKNGTAELGEALNIDIDDTLKIKRRDGYSLIKTGTFHSAYSKNERAFVVADGALNQIVNSDGDISFICSLDDKYAPMTYDMLGNTLAYANGTDFGIVSDIINEEADTTSYNAALLAAEASLNSINLIGTKLSSVSDAKFKKIFNSYDLLLSGKPNIPQNVNHVGFYGGKIYVAQGNFLLSNKAFSYHIWDESEEFIPFPDKIKMNRPVKDGIYIAVKGQVFFLNGGDISSFNVQVVSDCDVIEFSDTEVEASNFNIDTAIGKSALWMAKQGLYLGLPGGLVLNLTKDRITFPPATRGRTFCDDEKILTTFKL